jgi:hypothetical protein
MMTYEGMDVQIHVFLTSALDGDELSVSRPGRFTLVIDPRYPLDRRLVGPQNRAERRGEEKNYVPTGTRTPTPRSSSSVASRCPDSQDK